MSFKGLIYLCISLLTYAFTNLTDKIGVEQGVDPSVFSFFRVFFGMIFVAAIWFAIRRKQKLKIEKKHLKHLIIIGALASGLGVVMTVYALEFTTATNRGIMQGMYTAVTLIFAYFMLGERLPKLFYPVFFMMILGLVLLTSDGFLQLPNKGDFILLLTVPLFAYVNVYAKRTMKNISTWTVSFGRYIFGAAFLLLMLPIAGLDQISTLGNGLTWVILSAILSSLRVLTFYKGIELEGPTIAATMLAIAPAITAISEYIVLDTTFSHLQIAGLALVLICAILVTRLKANYQPNLK